MSRKFLTNIDLKGNELLNGVIQNLTEDPENGKAGQIYFNTEDQVLKIYNGSDEEWQAVGSEEFIGDAVASLIQSGDGISVDYDDEGDSLTIANTGVLSVAGTNNEVTVSASAGDVTIGLPESITVDVTGDLTGNADTATALETARTISLGGSLSGSASFDGTENITIEAFIDSESGVSSIAGTENQISVSASVGAVTIALTEDVDIVGDLEVGNNLIVVNHTNLQDDVDIDGALKVSASAYFENDVVIDGDLTVHGDLNVDGTVNAIDRTEINLEDNTIRLNSGLSASATPTENAGIIVERGAEDNADLRWNETLDQWEIGFEGGSYEAIIATNDLTEDVEDIVGNLIVGGETIAVNYEDANGELFMDVILSASGSYLLTSFDGLSVDIATLETQLIADSFTRKAAADVGNGVNFSFALVHNFDTRDVVVNVYDKVSFDTVEVDVVRTDADTVTVTFAEAPAAGAYRVVIIG
jgi:hypothetical protein